MIPTIPTLAILIPALPLAALLVTAILGPRILRTQSHWPTILAFIGSCLASLALLYQVSLATNHATPTSNQSAHATTQSQPTQFETIVPLWHWLSISQAISTTQNENSTTDTSTTDTSTTDTNSETGQGRAVLPFSIPISLRVDSLTALMLCVVTFISTLVALYSIGYMHGDPGYWRFFAYIALFVFSMTMLVSVSNFLLLYVFWELVGLSSYLLIGFWYEKPAAAAAGKKAFLVNRIGDFGFALGIFLLWVTYGTLDFHDTVQNGITLSTGIFGPSHLGHYVGGWVGTAIPLLLLLGACGKSAQFPLHIWLPDAMEGPTPVIALIHAATMVTAGIYMIARCMPLFVVSPFALHTVSIVGGITALIGAIIALTQTDLKRILAYSTISHLGYMFIALGTGTLLGVTAGMFHLITHAFFKALLFLAAGSVMHAMGNIIDIRRFSGLRHRLPITHWTFLFGALAMIGMAPFAGFWSKDAILVSLGERSLLGHFDSIYLALYWSTLLGILLLDIYTFRPFFLTFYGKEKIPKEAGSHAHESPWTMTLPLIILALGALAIGWFLDSNHRLEHILLTTPSIASLQSIQHTQALDTLHSSIALKSTLLVFSGLLLTAFLYLGTRHHLLQLLTNTMKRLGLYQLSFGKLFFDPIYYALIVFPLEIFAQICAWFDRQIIDRLVDLFGSLPVNLGLLLRPLQGGLVPFYALAMALGLLALLGAILI